MIPFPKDFISNLEKLFGQESSKLLDSLDQEVPSSIRLNKSKLRAEDMLALDLADAVPWSFNSFYLNKRPNFTLDPFFHLGYYYVQEASSMLLAQIKPMLPEEPILALDLCAAPGGKSTLLHDLLPKGSVLVSNELISSRANILKENIQKWGSPLNIVSSEHPSRWSAVKNTFDLILVDAPCSGEGMFRKEPQARSEWQVDSPSLCAKRQIEILDAIYPCLKDNGLLVYSTCTFNREENEDIVQYLLRNYPLEALSLNTAIDEKIRSHLIDSACYRMMPHKIKGEGLFMAVFRKENTGQRANKELRKSNLKAKVKQSKSLIPQEVKAYIHDSDAYSWQIIGENIIQALPLTLIPLFNKLQSQGIYMLNAGVSLAQIKGRNLIPLQSLALSTAFNPQAFAQIELSQEECLLFLAKQDIKLQEAEKGIKLLTHKSAPLGFVKHLGNRVNNLYPNEWRIRNLNLLNRFDEADK